MSSPHDDARRAAGQPTPGRRPPLTLVLPTVAASITAVVSAVLVLWEGWRAYRTGAADDPGGWYLVGALMLPWAVCVVLASAWALRRSRFAHMPLVGLLVPALVVSLRALGSPVDRVLAVGWLVVAVGSLCGLLSPQTARYQSTAGNRFEPGERA